MREIPLSPAFSPRIGARLLSSIGSTEKYRHASLLGASGTKSRMMGILETLFYLPQDAHHVSRSSQSYPMTNLLPF